MSRQERSDRPLMIWCDCGTDAVGVYYFEEGVLDEVVELSFWSNSTRGPQYSWRHRIRQAVKWLRGDPDSPAGVVLTREEADRLAEALRLEEWQIGPMED